MCMAGFSNTKTSDKQPRINVIVGDLANLEEKVDGIGEIINETLDGVEELKTRFGTFENRVGSIETKLTSVDTHIGSIETKLTTMDTRLTSIETKLSDLPTKDDLKNFLSKP